MFSARRHGHGFSRQPGPKGTGGERKAPSAPAGANPCPRRGMTRRLRHEGRACSPMGRSIVSVGDPKGVQGASGKPPCWHDKRQLCRRNSPLAGPDAPTPAREKGLQPYGALTLFFRWRKKSVQKKASGTATPGKSPLLPIFERGSSQCRAQHSWTANIYVRARSCSLFSSFKKGKAFSLRCLSPLCPGAVGVGHTYPLRVGMLRCGLRIFAALISGREF